MSAEIIQFPKNEPEAETENEPTGRDALIDLAMGCPGEGSISGKEASVWADWILKELWMRGYEIVPHEEPDLND